MPSNPATRQNVPALSQNVIDISDQRGDSDKGASGEFDPALYGLVFTPSHEQADTHRTIIIARLPENITLPTVLGSVRGGAIRSAQLLNTLKLTGFMTVRVVFSEGYSAVSYEEHATRYPIKFNGVTSKVTLVAKPTWPAKFNPFHTRRLEVQGLPRWVTPLGLQQTIGLVLNHPIRTEKLDNGNLVLEFSSTDKAGYTYEVLLRTYRGCRPHFISDPCARPLETLLSPVPAISSSTAVEAETYESLETRDSLDNNPNSAPDARSYSSGLGPSLLDTANPEELDAVYRPLLPS